MRKSGRRELNDYAISALGIEAERRHTSYGKLVGMTTREEREEIAYKYLRSRKRRGHGKNMLGEVTDFDFQD